MMICSAPQFSPTDSLPEVGQQRACYQRREGLTPDSDALSSRGLQHIHILTPETFKISGDQMSSTQNNIESQQTDQFHGLRHAFPVIFLVFIVLAVPAAILISALSPYLPWLSLLNSACDRTFFEFYLLIYASVWITYFSSRHAKSLFAVRSLRRFLQMESYNWKRGSEEYEHIQCTEIANIFREKARSGVTVTALMVTTTTLVLGQIGQIIINANRDPSKFMLDQWIWGILFLAAISAFTAVICFLLAVDALDVLFNKFRDENGTSSAILRSFFLASVNPRYAGFILLLLLRVLVSAVFSPTFASVAIGIILSIGYRLVDTTVIVKYDQNKPQILLKLERAAVGPLGWLSALRSLRRHLLSLACGDSLACLFVCAHQRAALGRVSARHKSWHCRDSCGSEDRRSSTWVVCKSCDRDGPAPANQLAASFWCQAVILSRSLRNLHLSNWHGSLLHLKLRLRRKVRGRSPIR